MHGLDLVTVVIPAADEERSIGACLDSVRAQDYTRLQIVVVDGASTDQTVAIVREHQAQDPRVELVHNPQRAIAVSLNCAVENARGRWLVRVDAHSTIDPTYVRTAVERLREGGWGGVGGRKDAVGRTPAGRAIAVAMSSRLGVGNSTYHHGTCVQEVDHLPFGAYPTDLVRRLGGWNPDLAANEDYEFDYRVRRSGNRLLFDPRMVIKWQCRESIGDLYRQYRRYGRGKADVARLHPTSLSARHVLPPALVAYLAVAGTVALRRPRWAGLMVGPYVLALGAESVRCTARLQGVQDGLRLPAAFAAMHLGWGVGFWSGLRQSRVSAAPDVAGAVGAIACDT
jgi:succinoglycan biosynthesis protein ExoA